MKRMVAAILSLAMVMTLGACGASGGSTTPSDGKTGSGSSRKVEKPAADTLDGILAAIADDYKTTIQTLQDGVDEINTAINGDYENYAKNRQMIDDWYAQAETEAAELFQRTEENCRQYFILMSTQTEHEYKAMNKAAEKIYDDVYDDAWDDFYDDVYDGLMEDLYDAYYDGVLDDAYNLVPYKEYSEQKTYFYETWSGACSEIYRLLSEHGSRLYGMCSAIGSAIYQDDYDFAAVLERYDAETAEQARRSEQTDTAQSTDAAVETDAQSTSAADDAAIRPEFQKAMDSYEAFFSEYAELMQSLSNDPGNLTLLAKYADYMSQYTETMEALDSIDEDELTTAELSYYIEVMSRIQQMLLAAAG